MKTKEEIITMIEEGINIGMNKFFLNGLLFCLDRRDLSVSFDERLTEKRFMEIINKVKQIDEVGK